MTPSTNASLSPAAFLRASAWPVSGLAALGLLMSGYFLYEGATYSDPVGAGLALMIGILLATPCVLTLAVYAAGFATDFRSVGQALLGGVVLVALAGLAWWLVASILF
jgi:hypothetical protein